MVEAINYYGQQNYCYSAVIIITIISYIIIINYYCYYNYDNPDINISFYTQLYVIWKKKKKKK